MVDRSPLHSLRLAYEPEVPLCLDDIANLAAEETSEGAVTGGDLDALEQLFPNTIEQLPMALVPKKGLEHKALRVGVVLSGGQAPGGHNVIAGIHDALKILDSDSVVIGFLGGPSGIIDNDTIEISEALVNRYRDTGGFDMIGSGRTKIATPEQFAKAAETAKALELDGIVIIGGDDSNTNAALLAEYFVANEIATRVVGVPKTIDGDLKSGDIEASFGFDTASKVYSEMIGNILRDALSAKKYYFFIKLMGRSASHITLECALQTHPNLTLISEEVASKGMSLQEVTGSIADLVIARHSHGKMYGSILIPEGVIEFIPEFKAMIGELNTCLAEGGELLAKLESLSEPKERIAFIRDQLSEAARHCYDIVPNTIKEQLILDRDPHGNVQVSKIDTERMLIETVKAELQHRGFRGKFSAQPAFFGYEGRSAYPSNFDCNYCYSLGMVAGLLIDQGATGHMACVKGLTRPVAEWEACGVPITSMMTIETRHGTDNPVIQKALVDLEGEPFKHLRQHRVQWAEDDLYRSPGPIQFSGPPEVADTPPLSLMLEHQEQAIPVA